jgi:hypothetical protein
MEEGRTPAEKGTPPFRGHSVPGGRTFAGMGPLDGQVPPGGTVEVFGGATEKPKIYPVCGVTEES